MPNRNSLMICIVLFAVSIPVSPATAADPPGLRRSLGRIKEKPDDLTTDKAHYKQVFGIGDEDAPSVKGIARFGELTVDPGGASKTVRYDREEQVYFVVKGSGMLIYDRETVPVKKNDFMYLPAGVQHGVSSASAGSLQLLVMGFFIPEGKQITPTPKLMLASADDVGLQVLGQHGPTTQFRLLLGPTRSTRDKLPASQQITSLFIMDFAAGGTNIPHTHPVEEEIYFVLRGRGEMVSGGTAAREARYACTEGDAFYFPPKTLIGYYSGATEGQPHDLIIAVRSLYTSPGN
jgi:mannose-6-phosphate isomerase-like protein (cupin superfamily)